jgi:DNA primase
MSLAEDILDGLDIVDVVGRYMNLQRAGTNYK